ncbi:MAG TPA: hypothetical protein VII53_09225 [Solirubrobacteraceae bacterium]
MQGRTCGAARCVSAIAVLSALLVALLALQSPPSALAAGACPNEALRTGLSAALPDCRAYELVSTAQPNNDDIISGNFTADGSHVSYGTSFEEPGPLSDVGSNWIAEPTPGGWVSTGMTLLGDEVEGTGGIINGSDPGARAYSENGSQGVYITVHALNPTDTNDAPDVYEGSTKTSFTWLTENAIRGPLYSDESDMEYEGSTADLSTVVFQARQQLLPQAPLSLGDGGTGREIYGWHDGRLSLVSVLPGETTGAPDGAAVGSGPANEANLNAVSANGLEVFFESPDPAHNEDELPTQLYVRIDGERTVEVSAPAPGVVDPEGPKAATYVGATPDGSKVFFIGKGALTTDANTYYDTEEDLYEYDLETETLTDISSAALTSPEGSQVQGLVGTSENGDMVYFVARGVLSAQNMEGKEPAEGAYNLYLWNDGTITYVAALNTEDGESHGSGVWGLKNKTKPADVTANGEHLALISLNSLTEYEANGHPEMYEYAAQSGTITCVSCDLSGAPIGSGVEYADGSTAVNGTPRFMNEDGSEVFFDTSEPLVSVASNGQANVYEYENGHQYLISTGTSSGSSQFESMSSGGDHVLFLTRQLLVPSATGEEIQLYDARVDGGFPAPALLACTGTGCQGVPPPPPIFATPPSMTFSGVGNFAASASVVPAKPKTKKKKKKKKKTVKCAKAKKLKQKAKRVACDTGALKKYGPPHKHSSISRKAK